MKMLSRTLEMIRDEKEICEFGNAFGKQISTLFNNLSEEKVRFDYAAYYSSYFIMILNFH
jgi:hypothetical protein